MFKDADLNTVEFSDASSEDENTTIEAQLALNQARFARDFHKRVLHGDLNLIKCPNYVFAEYLSYRHIKPQWYMPHGNLRDATLADFIEFCETARHDNHAMNQVIWERVKSNKHLLRYVSKYDCDRDREIDLRDWVWSIDIQLSCLYGKMQSDSMCHGQVYGLSGLVAYTDKTTGHSNDQAAFISQPTHALCRNGSPFAGVALVYADIDDNKPWYKVKPQALPKTLAAVSGSPTCAVGFFLCNYGFRLI